MRFVEWIKVPIRNRLLTKRIGNQIVLDSHGEKAKAACHEEGTLALEMEESIDASASVQ